MSVTHGAHSIESQAGRPALLLSFELSWGSWKLAFCVGNCDRPRLRTIGGRDLTALKHEIALAKARFQLPADALVRSCYEAGRDGFWLQRWLVQEGIDNIIVDSASIEVSRRRRRAKSDRLDAVKLLSMLVRHHHGEKKVWSVLWVPEAGAEDRRQLHRELATLKQERVEHVNRIKGLLAACGVSANVSRHFVAKLAELRSPSGEAVPPELQKRLVREFERWQLVDRQLAELERERLVRMRSSTEVSMTKVRKLLGLKAIGRNSSWLFVMELFSWRRFRNRRQVGSAAGLTPTPYDSGGTRREQGISKAGNRRVRALAIEIAWLWLRYQPTSRLSRWYRERFGKGKSRMRRIGIVALARKLLVALWRYLEHDVLPEDAVVVDWQTKLSRRRAEVA